MLNPQGMYNNNLELAGDGHEEKRGKALSHPELLKSSANPGSGCRVYPAGGVGCPHLLLLPSTLADGERAKREKKVFSGDTPTPPAEGLPPSCTT